LKHLVGLAEAHPIPTGVVARAVSARMGQVLPS
jgi:hypothetical protein